MKKILTLLLLVITVQVFSQTYPITGINISLPANPDANTANWGSGTSLFTITANAKAANGRVDGHVMESKILVTIKKGRAKVCGSFTANSAPVSNFNTLTKVWSGNNAISLLGQSCTLPPGDYEICVQFFGNGAAGVAPLSEEKTRAFSIRGNEQQTYQPPQAIAPANGTSLSEADAKKPITFRWTPLIPRPQEPVTYRLKVWQLMQGQNGVQAMKVNQPIITKDVDNMTQAVGYITGDFTAPQFLAFVWNVQALNREGKPVGGNNGTSEALKFTVRPVNDSPSIIALISPANGSTISAKDKPKFTWTFKGLENNYSSGSNQLYKIKIVEIVGNQSPEDAIKNNKPFFEKEGLTEQFLQYSSSAPSFIAGKKYGWNVSIFDRWGKLQSSTASMFFASSCDVNLILKLRSVECLPDSGKNKRYKIGVSATYTSAVYNLTYANSGSGFKAYHPSYTPNYTIANISPGLQMQNSGLTTTITYSFEVSVQLGQTAIKVGLQGDDKDPGPITCQPGAELDVNLHACNVNTTCDCGKWGPLVIDGKKYECGSKITWNCKKPFEFTSSYQCSPNNESCQAKTTWEVRKGETLIKSGTGTSTLSDGFDLIVNGTYTLTLNAECNEKKCPPCIYTIVVEDCKDADYGTDSCKNNLIRNGGFDQANVSGTMPLPGTVQHWVRGYGSPIVDNSPTNGFIEKGYIKLAGNINNGQAVAQGLNSNNKIILGKKYKLSVAVRFMTSQNTLDYVKIRVIAYNGNIFSTTGIHPLPSTDVAIIGRSGKIRDCNDWSVIELPVWTANKDFSNIAINAFTNDGSNASVWIDNITICESAQGDCDEVQVESTGNPIMPAGYGDIPPGFACQPEAEEDDYYNGSLQDLYPGYNGTTDLYSQTTNPCFSIGGTLPPEVNNYNCDDSLRAAGINMTCEELQAMLNQGFTPTEIKKSVLAPILPIGNIKCDRPGPKNMENMPFQGRDIIYIHGLQLSHIIDRANGHQGATGKWPNNQSEYYSGYYKNVATNNMLPHISHFLRNRGNLNRFIIVSYDCSESAEVAVHAILAQIREAMENGTGVQSDPSDPRKTNCFGRDYIMISHSTGALVADVALSIANKTKTDLNLKTQYGEIGLISDRCKGRVSIQGAYSGSNLAKIAVVGAQANPVLFSAALTALAFAPVSSQTIATILANTDIIPNSILVDLVPSISRSRWGSYINDISVPVFTIAGGHPSAILGPLKYSIHKGFDDGVESMDAANGNNNSLSLGPSSFNATPIKVFDMGIPLIRGINYYLDQKISQGVFAAASTAYLSPTGMVVPVSSINVDPQNHFNNHFSFIQSSKEHWFNATEPGSGNIPCDYSKTFFGGSTNNEEELVVTNASLFTPGLIDPSIISQMGETLKDKHIDYPWLKLVYRYGIPRPTVYWKRFYIWKRTYHKLIDNCMYDVDYAYKYLFKQ